MASQNPIGVFSQYAGGNASKLNITAAGVVKASKGILYRIIPSYAAVPTGGNLTINDANGYVTAQTITAITQATAAVITLSTGGATNPFAVGNTIIVASAAGMTQINGVVGTVTAIGGVTTAWTVTTNINSSAFSAWTSSGTAASFGVQNQIISVLGTAFTTLPIASIDWPCLNGIIVSSFPTGGTTVQAAISYF